MKEPIKNLFGFGIFEIESMDPDVILLGPRPKFVIDPDTYEIWVEDPDPNQVVKIILK